MTSALKNEIEKAGQLPEKEQQQIEMILDEISWELTLANSSKQLDFLAEEAREEYKNGNTKPLDLLRMKCKFFPARNLQSQ